MAQIKLRGPKPPGLILLLRAHLDIIARGPSELVGKNLIEGKWAPCINIIVNYCCMRVLLYAKLLLKDTETEETTVVFVTFLSSVAFQLGGGPSGYANGSAIPEFWLYSA